MAISLGFRETSLSFAAIIALWHVTATMPAWRTNDWRRHFLLLPYVVLAAGYLLLRTDLLRVPLTGETATAGLRQSLEQLWHYWRMLWFPVVRPETDWARTTSQLLGIAGMTAFVVAAWFRRWNVVFCGAAVLLSIAPFAPLLLGVGGRYLYYPLAFFAIGSGVAAADLLRARPAGSFPLAVPAIACAVLALSSVLSIEASGRLRSWRTDFADPHQQWVTQLRSEQRTIEGGTLCVTNVPFVLALFDGFAVQPTVAYYYPSVRTVHMYDVFTPPHPDCADGPEFVFSAEP